MEVVVETAKAKMAPYWLYFSFTNCPLASSILEKEDFKPHESASASLQLILYLKCIWPNVPEKVPLFVF
jgi:hypothetical protein